jgi:hypothetical protein
MPDVTKEEDAVDFLLSQHAQVHQLFATIETGSQEDRDGAFEMLVRLLAVHETAEEMVLYPVVRAKVPGGAELVDARTAEEDKAKKMV